MEIFYNLLGKSWADELGFQFLSGEYFNKLGNFINKEYKNNNCYPSKKDIFKIFHKLSPVDARIVILGQDPYPQKDVATGLSFGIREDNLVIPPSLKIIKSEVFDDVYPDKFIDTFDYTLESWVNQGVFLLNTALTVRENEPESHSYMWEEFTKTVISILNTHPGKIFLLWGKHAQSYQYLINERMHYILTAAHPASEVYKRGAGFFDCKHFSKVNEIIEKNNGIEYKINW